MDISRSGHRLMEAEASEIHIAANRRVPRCSSPGFDGAVFSREWKDALLTKFSTGAPRQHWRSVERYSIAKQAPKHPK
jgi:hypothetical protein